MTSQVPVNTPGGLIYCTLCAHLFPLGFARPTRRSPGVTLSTSPLQCQSAVALIADHLVAVTAYTTVRWDNAGVPVWAGRLPIRR